MNILNLSPNGITKVVISHEHEDHAGGLKELEPYIKNIELFRVAHKGSYDDIKISVPEVPEKIVENVWTTGRMSGLVDEQALILKGNKGWYMLTGCSHPGVENILQIAQQIGTIVGIIGGFHGFTQFRSLKGFDFICPCHCTAHKKDLKSAFPNSYSSCGVGKVIDLNTGL
jgi:7,8-dihydropterin-6-yl-methyl-4-(beta-D-ribofuranosyl)aminobenzene 5'-phosphate synthase